MALIMIINFHKIFISDGSNYSNDSSHRIKNKISNSSESSLLSKFKNQSPFSSPKRIRKNMPRRNASLVDGLVKVKQIDPISVNKARIKNSSSFLNKLIR